MVKALADEEGEDWSIGSYGEKKSLLGPEHSLGLGLGFRVASRQNQRSSMPSSPGSGSVDFSGEANFQVTPKASTKRFLGPLSNIFQLSYSTLQLLVTLWMVSTQLMTSISLLSSTSAPMMYGCLDQLSCIPFEIFEGTNILERVCVRVVYFYHVIHEHLCLDINW